MIVKEHVPFGGVQGWIADLTLPKGGRAQSKASSSYYSAEPNERLAMAAIRAFAGLSKDAILIPRRALSRRDLATLGMTPGQVKAA